MNEFDDIRPFQDCEVPEALARLISDPELLDLLISRQFPRFHRLIPVIFSAIARPFLRRHLLSLTKDVSTVSDFQRHMTSRLIDVLNRTTDSYEFSGLEHLDPHKAYVFMSNHRDIALDPAIINLGLVNIGRDTVRIAIGDNLLSKPFASDLMRINRSFIVKRSVKNRRDKLNALKHLSKYIRHSIEKENVSIWIAQAEGRAKDGVDKTDTALLKMLALSKAQDQSFDRASRDLNIVPVAISYEYDPCDGSKARELHYQQMELSYTKDPFEDLDSIQKGFVDFKGRIRITFGKPVDDKCDNADQLAEEIDRQIHLNYKLFPTNIIAWQLQNNDFEDVHLLRLKSQWPDEDWHAAEISFKTRINMMPKAHRSIAISAYAAPVASQLRYLTDF
jgi:1-acyl-sn-glycerol-3-phosphate acyltransferase